MSWWSQSFSDATLLSRNDALAREKSQTARLISDVNALRLLPRFALAVGFLAVYVALEWISFIHEYKGVPITPWNPGLGFVFALILLGGPFYAAVLFAGVIVAEVFVLRTNLSWPIIIGIAAIYAVVYGTVASMARNRLRLDLSLYHLRDVFILLLIAVWAAVLVALFLSVLLLLDADIELPDVVTAFAPLLVGDIIGMAVVTPIVLRIAHQTRALHARRVLVLELSLYAVLTAAALWVIAGTGPLSGFKFFYLLFVPVVVAAVRYGLDGACFSLALSQIGLVGVLQFYGVDAKAFTEFQLLMLALTATGLVVGGVVSEREISDRAARVAEKRLKEKEAEATQAAKFTLVSGTASALAHELNQPMTAARALARSVQELLRASPPDMKRADGNLATMIAQVDHASGIVKRMRDFLRRGTPRISTLDVKTLLTDALALADAEISARRIRIRANVSPDLPTVFGDRVQLQQVVLNLVRNASDAIAGAGKSNGEIVISVHSEVQPDRLEFGILDNGPGLDAEVADRLFEPLVTSKIEGLGLGLPISMSIVEAHGGKIWLHSHAPGATEFRFSLPLRPIL